MDSTHAAVWDVWRSAAILGGICLFGFLGVAAIVFRRGWPASAALATLAMMVALVYMIADQTSRFGDGDLTWRLPLLILSEFLAWVALRMLWKRRELRNGLAGEPNGK